MTSSDCNTSDVFTKGPPDVNIVVVGDSYVGKTSLLKTFVTREYPMCYDEPSLERYFEDITVDGQDFHLVIWEPIALENHEKMREFIYGKAECVVVCYAVNDLESFGRVESFWFPEIHKSYNEVPIIIAGMKIDLRNNHFNCISRNKGKELKVFLSASGFIECSSLFDVGVKDLFTKAVQCALKCEKCKVT